MLKPFTLQEIGAGRPGATHALFRAPQQYQQISGDSSFCAWIRGGQITCQRPSPDNSMVRIHRYMVEMTPCSLRIQTKRHTVLLCYIRSGSFCFGDQFGEEALMTGSWQLWPWTAGEVELYIREDTQALWLIIPDDQVAGFRITFPQVVEMLTAKGCVGVHSTRSEKNDLMVMMADTINKIAGSGLKLSEGQIWELVDTIFMCAIAQLSEQRPNPDKDLSGRAAQMSIIRAKLLARVHNGVPPSLSELVRTAGLCARSLQTAFKSRYRVSMMDYFCAARMEAIARQLLVAYKTLQEIAFDFNYKDYSTFSAAVSRWWGASPSVIRKRGQTPVINGDQDYEVRPDKQIVSNFCASS